ncbi:MAG: ThiF family adenylyltransferase [Desulfosarcinaceae bacterium]|nr:ThiF family adenylyltransferase [Desulfosarcinaceae bacterium]
MDHALTQRILTAATDSEQPDGETVKVLEVATVAQLAARSQVSRRTIEITALRNGILPLRYARNFKTYDREDQITLLESHVAVVGLGGLGGAVSEALARVGLGRLTLVDGDTFSDHNLNRQAHCTETNLGVSKAAAAADRIRTINATTETFPHADYLTAQNAAAILAEVQVVVDCLDNIPGRFTLAEAAGAVGIPMVSAAVGGEAGHLLVIFPGDRSLEQIYGPPQARAAAKGAETSLGCLPHIVTLMANLEVNETLRILLGRGSGLRGRMRLVDLAGGLFETIEFQG